MAEVGVSDLAARCVKGYAEDVARRLVPLMARDDALPRGVAQKSTGKLWLASDWRPEHLVPIYHHWEDRIVDAVLDGTLAGRVPVLTSVITPDAQA
jgi:hypothetical protein